MNNEDNLQQGIAHVFQSTSDNTNSNTKHYVTTLTINVRHDVAKCDVQGYHLLSNVSF